MISVCMPCFNRPEHLERSIRAYERLYDEIELSIVDDRSSPPLKLPETSLDVVISRIEGPPEPKNPCVPINQAINQSTNPIIVLTNPEIEHREPIFEEMWQSLQNWNDYVTAGCVDVDGTRLVPKKRRFPLPEGAGLHFCVMFSRLLWKESGGFDENYRDGQAMDDVDWVYTAEKAGANFILRDDLTVWHHRTGLKWPGSVSRNTAYFKRKWNLS